MIDKIPPMRKDLEFFPLQQGNQQIILIKDHLGLVREGQGIAPHLYQFMTILDGTKTIRDLQMELMHQRGGVLVGSDEVHNLLTKLDESYLLDSDNFQTARQKIVADFTNQRVRPCTLCGRSYPSKESELKLHLDDLLNVAPSVPPPQGKITALVAPHIDLTAGAAVYASAYQMLKYVAPSRIILLGTGHRLMKDLFCITDKDFETPLGVTKSEPDVIGELGETGKDVLAVDDFAHRAEHSIEFQIIFLQHLLGSETFRIIPILCGSILNRVTDYKRIAYQQRTGPFLQKLKSFITPDTLVLAGVDFSHIGLKFGHDIPADYLEKQATAHDQNLLKYLSLMDVDNFWQESISVRDRFNVCGFPVLACMLEVLSPARGEVLNYRFWHEKPTQSAVSFAAVVFTAP